MCECAALIGYCLCSCVEGYLLHGNDIGVQYVFYS